MESGIRVNMSSAEGKSTTHKPLPAGTYLMAITEIEVDEVKNPPQPGKKDNRGEPLFKIELTVQDGDYEDRRAWTNVMLFKGALYSIAQMLKAQGVEVKEVGDSAEFQVEGFEPNTVPGPEWWSGKVFAVRLSIKGKRKDKITGKEYDERNEVKGFMSVDDYDPNKTPRKPTTGAGRASSSGTSLLP